MEKPLKYQNSKTGTFNMQKKWFSTWDKFNYLINKDERVKSANLQKPDQFRSFVIRKLIESYLKERWDTYDEGEFQEWLFREQEIQQLKEENRFKKIKKRRRK